MEAANLQVGPEPGTYRSTITIRSAAQDVFAVLCDVESWPQWLPTVTSVRRTGTGPASRPQRSAPSGPAQSPGPPGSPGLPEPPGNQPTAPIAPGETFQVKQPRLLTAVWRVSEVDVPRSFTWSSRRAGITVTGGHRVEPVGAGEVKVTLSIEQRGPLRRLVAPLTAGLTGRYLLMEAEALKHLCEQPPGPEEEAAAGR